MTDYVIPTNEVWLSVVTSDWPSPNKQFHLHWDGWSVIMRLKRKHYGRHETIGDVYKHVGGNWVLYGTVADGEFFPACSAPADKFLLS